MPKLTQSILTAVTDRAESRAAFDTFKTLLTRGCKRLRKRIGWPGGNELHWVFWNPRERIWFTLTADRRENRFWCPFGTQNPDVADMLNIVVQCNPPVSGMNRRCAGVFATAGGRIYLAHSGKIGGGREGIGKNAFTNFYPQRGRRIVEWPNNESSEVILLGALDDKALPARIAEFVRSVEKCKKRISAAKVRESNVQVVLGGANIRIDDFTLLEQAARDVGKAEWACGKHTFAGDTILIYFQHPRSAIVAIATASEDAEPGIQWPYYTELENVKLLPAPVDLKELRKMFPRWRWLKQPRNNQYLDKEKANALLKRVALILRADPISVKISGGGFGTPEQNRIVEAAARQALKRHFRGYKVISREKENLGYDFDVCRRGEVLHVELKGVSGEGLGFPITANEVRCAETDDNFHIAVVTNARRVPRVRIFTAREFLTQFKTSPLAYYANFRQTY
jgi:hypothetical protein